MPNASDRSTSFRRTQLETCEDRSLMAVDALAVPELRLDYLVGQQFQQQGFADNTNSIQTLNTPAHNQTGWTNVRTNYGLTGRGQTVAVIDSGIAYDHLALGGGYGANYRVVGGWDFAENDANPYDDGPAGSHGTHVAGIISSTDVNSPGVAGGTDLVALRVFDDQGSGNFTWVENALRWVHQNRNAFANPITTVNLSIGAGWNSSTVPPWAMLEDEFAQLKAAGIFISVAAGNSYGQYNTPGLDYPAASSYVVPVMSTNSDGTLSSFSQRHSRSIAAPGAGIRSTVPDYLGNANGRTDDFATFSGTSMAAPYIAGASTLIRQAMQIAGHTTINQDTIYQHMINTSDSLFDSATQTTYRRLNLQRAIDTLIPADEFGNTTTVATALSYFGGNNQTYAGIINNKNDSDFVRFTATSTGTVTLRATASSDLSLRWLVNGSTTAQTGNTVTLNVVSGQSYTLGLATGSGIGRYTITSSMASSSIVDPGNGNSGNTFAPPSTTVNLGAIAASTRSGINVSGDSWFKFSASRTGTFTAQTLVNSGTNLTVKVYSASGQLLQSRSVTANDRVDFAVTSGQEFFIQLSGTATGAGLRLTNLVTLSGATVNVGGTAGNDAFAVAAGTNHTVTVNGVVYSFSSSQVNTINVDGGAGTDTITMSGSTGNDTAVLRVGSGTMRGASYTLNASNIERITMNGGGGANSIQFYDSTGDDVFYANSNYATISGTGFVNISNGFSSVTAYASTGRDLANFHDTAGNDTLNAYAAGINLSGTGYSLNAYGFDATQVYAINGGNDVANLFDTTGNDLFSAMPEMAILMGTNYYNLTSGFDRVTADARNGGWDMAYFFDSLGNDTFTMTPTTSQMAGTGYANTANGFDFAVGYATRGGYDTANFYDGVGNDTFESDGAWGKLTGNGYGGWANGFDSVILNGNAGGTNTVTRRATAQFVFSQLGRWS